MRQRILGGIILILTAATSNAALLGRLPATPGGTNYLAYYDDVQNITWLADADLVATQPLDVAGLSGGEMMAPTADEWIAALNRISYLGQNRWHLPNIVDTGTPGCNFTYGGTDCGYNVDLTTGQLAHLYTSTLGNHSYYDTNGNTTGCSNVGTGCLTNAGPFSNIRYNTYWSPLEDATLSGARWFFYIWSGGQNAKLSGPGIYGGSNYGRAWPVLDGDVGDGLVDTDGDGLYDYRDNCPGTANSNQADADSDGRGNACDNCPSTTNPGQLDSDGDLVGNLCDNCPTAANAGQEDSDGDGRGTVCDNCPSTANANQSDSDGDLRGNACDNCRLVANNTGAAAQCDADGDGFGNSCDGDLGSPAPGNGDTNAQDYAILRSRLGTSDAVADLNCNGTVNAQDYAIFRPLLGKPPGPAAAP